MLIVIVWIGRERQRGWHILGKNKKISENSYSFLEMQRGGRFSTPHSVSGSENLPQHLPRFSQWKDS